MKALGFDTLLVWQRSAGTFDRASDVHWLTNFSAIGTGQDAADTAFCAGYSFAAALFHDGREPELHTGQTRDETNEAALAVGEVIYHAPNFVTGLAERLKALGIEGRVAVVGSDILPGLYDRIFRDGTTQIEWVAQEDLLLDVQSIKSPRELETYRTAGDIVTRSLTAGMHALISGKSNAEAAAAAAGIVVAAGGGFHRIDMSHGACSERYLLSDTLYGYDTTAPDQGDMVRGWVYGPIYKGYWLDPGRTSVCGLKPSPEKRAVIDGAVSIVDAIVEAIRPGVTPRQLGVIGDNVARTVGFYESRQMLNLFGHRLGPYFVPLAIPVGSPSPQDTAASMRIDEPLQAGMVVAAEAFLTHKGIGTAGFEQNLIVTSDGSELLTRTPMIFW
jgi:Xaa-Pro dipeptidase